MPQLSDYVAERLRRDMRDCKRSYELATLVVERRISDKAIQHALIVLGNAISALSRSLEEAVN